MTVALSIWYIVNLIFWDVWNCLRKIFSNSFTLKINLHEDKPRWGCRSCRMLQTAVWSPCWRTWGCCGNYLTSCWDWAVSWYWWILSESWVQQCRPVRGCIMRMWGCNAGPGRPQPGLSRQDMFELLLSSTFHQPQRQRDPQGQHFKLRLRVGSWDQPGRPERRYPSHISPHLTHIRQIICFHSKIERLQPTNIIIND